MASWWRFGIVWWNHKLPRSIASKYNLSWCLVISLSWRGLAWLLDLVKYPPNEPEGFKYIFSSLIVHILFLCQCGSTRKNGES